MPQYMTPGIYVEEVEAGAKLIDSMATSVAGFLGVAEKGPVDEPTLVTNWSQYAREFGSFHNGGWLAHAVFLFFMNGGTKCYINNLATPSGAAKPPSKAPAKGPAKADEEGAATPPAEVEISIKNPDNITNVPQVLKIFISCLAKLTLRQVALYLA